MRCTRSLLLASAACLGLSAQEPRLGLSFNLLAPTGGFSSTTYAPTTAVPDRQVETYGLGLGLQFTASFPIDTRTAVRVNIGGATTRGTNAVAGEPDVNLEHNLVSLGAEMQFFSGSAYRHRGAYLFAGVSADFERFSRSYGIVDYDRTTSTNKSRLGGTIGVGRTFGFDDGMRFTMEAAYHKSLNASDADPFAPPAADFVKLSFGWIF